MKRRKKYQSCLRVFLSSLSSTLFIGYSIGFAYTDTEHASENNTSSYIIKRDDTLWDLAYKFLGDPFRWQDIWNSNQSIRDPHWIYPGNSLNIPGMSSGVRGENDLRDERTKDAERIQKYFNTKPHDASQDSNSTGLDASSTSSITNDIQAFIEKGFLGEDLFRKSSFLWTEKDAKNLILPGNAIISGDKDVTTYRQYDKITAAVIDNHQYSPGDTVDIFHPQQYLEYDGAVVNLVRRVALGKIEKVTTGNEPTILVTLLKTWDLVIPKDRIAPAAHFSALEIDTVVNAPKTIQGSVVRRVENTAAPYLYQTFILDKGAQSGVQLGDVFQVFTQDKKEKKKLPALSGCVINVGEQASTLMIIGMYTEKLAEGDEANLIKRIVFRKL